MPSNKAMTVSSEGEFAVIVEPSKSESLEALRQLYRNPSQRARELKDEGKKIIGYFCSYTPLEMLTAAGLVPFRMRGDTKEPQTVADSYLSITYCCWLRSVFDIAMKGRYDFLAGIVFQTPCDSMMNLFGAWRDNIELPYHHVIELPRVYDQLSVEFLKEEFSIWKKSLENLTGTMIAADKLREAIRLHNETRSLLRELYELRRCQPPLISGSEMMQIEIPLASLPVSEGNELLRGVIEEVKSREPKRATNSPRLFIVGNEMDDSSIIELIEDCGAHVVSDDLCVGTRFCMHYVEETEDPLTGLADHYLGYTRCPSTYRPIPESATRAEQMAFRFSYIKELAQDCNADGVVSYMVKYCDSQGWDTPDLREYLEDNSLPVLHMEHDYMTTTLAPMRTRIQGFVEIVR